MAAIQAWPRKDGMFFIVGKTFYDKDLLKRLGAKWNQEKRGWVGTRAAAEAVHADIMVRAKVAAYCHTPEAEIWVSEREVQQGMTDRNFCGYCDSHAPPAKILGVVPGTQVMDICAE
jgi:hypothetical protein